MNISHWTTRSLGDFAYWVASDFTAQIESKLEAEVISNNEFAERLGVSASRVSQVLNDPGNLTLGNTVKYARALGMKIALVMYNDADPENEKGPISAELFTKCWERLGKPHDFFDLQAMKPSSVGWIVYKSIAGTGKSNFVPIPWQQEASTEETRGRRSA